MRILRYVFWSVVLGAAFVVAWFAFFQLLAEGVRWFLLITHFPEDSVRFYADSIRQGAEITLKLTVISSIAGLILGLMAGVSKLSRNPIFRHPATFYVWLIRGTPLLVQLLFVLQGVPQILSLMKIDVVLTPYWAAFIGLSVNVGAYNAEVIRAGILAIPKGQWEAAQSLGLSSAQVMRYVVIPQALRIVIPPLVNNVVALLKDSSLAYVLGLPELVTRGERIIATTWRPVPIYAVVAAIYLLLTTVLTFFTNWLERRFQGLGAR